MRSTIGLLISLVGSFVIALLVLPIFAPPQAPDAAAYPTADDNPQTNGSYPVGVASIVGTIATFAEDPDPPVFVDSDATHTTIALDAAMPDDVNAVLVSNAFVEDCS